MKAHAMPIRLRTIRGYVVQRGVVTEIYFPFFHRNRMSLFLSSVLLKTGTL